MINFLDVHFDTPIHPTNWHTKLVGRGFDIPTYSPNRACKGKGGAHVYAKSNIKIAEVNVASAGACLLP